MHDIVTKSLQAVKPVFERIDDNALLVQARILSAFQKHEVSTRHFSPTNGYGYDDIGRDTLDTLFADALETEDALVRPQIANGTHAIYLAVCGLTRPGSIVLSITGQPYDTLQTAFSGEGALAHKNVTLQDISLLPDGFDYDRISDALSDPLIGLVYIQRSRGYAWRKAVSVEEIGKVCRQVKLTRPDVTVFVDNCYGECTESHEPCFFGVDCVAGSLIKNLGGGFAPTGGYIAGTRACISKIEGFLTVPGTGREVGSYAQSYRPYYQGLFMAPHATAQALKCAVLFSAAMKELGYEVLPAWNDSRADITQSIRFGSGEELVAFCRSIQASSPVDSQVTPEPWDMPGYSDPVIMAAGTFVQGATSELSADAPIREPYTVYLQGSLSLEHAILALDTVIGRMKN